MTTFNINNSSDITINNYVLPRPIPRIIRVFRLPLTNSDKKAIIDKKYKDQVMKYKWCVDNRNQVSSTTQIYNGKQISLHRYIMFLEGLLDDNLEVDHIDRNRLNNVVSNLRMVTNQENNRNKGKRSNTSSKYIGVAWYKQSNKWQAQVRHNNKKKHLGYYTSEEDAAKKYDEALKELDIRDDVKVYNFPQQ